MVDASLAYADYVSGRPTIEDALRSESTVADGVALAVDPRPVEQLLAALPASDVRGVFARAPHDGASGDWLRATLRQAPGAELRLVAFVEPRPGRPLDVDRLRLQMARRIPVALRPSLIVRVERLPRLADGTVDEDALCALPEIVAHPLSEPRPQPFLVPICPSGRKPPIYGIHTIGHNGDLFQPLSDALGPDQPVFGLGTASTDAAAPVDLVQTAASYCDELEASTPDGPVTLVGISLGGVAAFEVARQLRRRGREVALLALFDAAGPAIAQSISRRDRVSGHLGKAVREGPRYVYDRLGAVRKRVRRKIEVATLSSLLALDRPVPASLQQRALIEANNEAYTSYRFEPYDGPIVVYKAADAMFADQLAEDGLGWKEVARGPFRVTTVPGTHLSILGEPDVRHLARVFADDHQSAHAAALAASQH